MVVEAAVGRQELNSERLNATGARTAVSHNHIIRSWKIERKDQCYVCCDVLIQPVKSLPECLNLRNPAQVWNHMDCSLHARVVLSMLGERPQVSDGGGWRDGCAGEGGGAASVTAGAVRRSAWLGVAGLGIGVTITRSRGNVGVERPLPEDALSH